MVEIKSCSSYDISNSTLVPVIASYDSIGNIAPLYVRINNNPYKILSYYRTDTVGFPVFDCKIDFYGQCKNIKLSYHPREYVWTLKS